ncbi:MAG: phage virion morphogenesis protein [Sinobacteraceae bacterium]|nr:phage virion morphogenesis protein [Nevskiaceae bacterium]
MAGASIKIDIDDRDVRDYLNRLAQSLANLRPVMADIGEEVMIQTKSRIESGGPAPDGFAWPPLSPEYARRKAQLGAGNMPILVLHGDLLRSIHYEATDLEVEIGTDRVYGAAHQFGRPDIHLPPRPYLGLSASDKAKVISILRRWLSRP